MCSLTGGSLSLVSRTRLDLPAMSSYQRLIVHRVAQHFRLHHTVVDPEGQAGQKRAIILFKTAESRMYGILHLGFVSSTSACALSHDTFCPCSPVIRFLDLLEEEESPPQQVSPQAMSANIFKLWSNETMNQLFLAHWTGQDNEATGKVRCSCERQVRRKTHRNEFKRFTLAQTRTSSD